MRSKVWIGALASIAAIVTGAVQIRAADNPDEAVRNASMRFYVALNSLYAGDTAPMEKVWSHSTEVSLFDFEGGQFSGWNDVHGSYIAASRQNTGRHLTPHDIVSHADGNLGYAHLIESGVERDPRGGMRNLNERVTMVFRLEDGAWKLVHRHVDAPPGIQ